MFGYIRPVRNELLVKEANFYDAVYCGLCRYSGKHLSHASRFFLSYDFTALSLLRLSLCGEEPTVRNARCPYKLRKKPVLVCDEVFSFTASAFGLFAYYKWEDDLRDETGVRRFGKRLLAPFFRRIRKKSKRVCADGEALERCISGPIEELRALEAQNCPSPDRTADCFGRILRDVACDGLTGEKRDIAAQCGYHIGRFIYLVDAYDDLPADGESGNYNPFLAHYGSVEQALAQEAEIRQTLEDSLNVFSRTYALACGPNLTGIDRILFNISDLGGREAIRQAQTRRTKGEPTHV